MAANEPTLTLSMHRLVVYRWKVRPSAAISNVFWPASPCGGSSAPPSAISRYSPSARR